MAFQPLSSSLLPTSAGAPCSAGLTAMAAVLLRRLIINYFDFGAGACSAYLSTRSRLGEDDLIFILYSLDLLAQAEALGCSPDL